MDINKLLQLAAKENASDVHLLAMNAPVFRIDGNLVTLDCEPLTGDDTAEIFASITSEKSREMFHSELELDFAYVLPDCTRFRVNACRQQGSISLAFRVVNKTIPSLEDLGLPYICRELILKENGLILVTGPTGTGKSTTQAAMIEHLNQHQARRVITIEDPMEYEFDNHKCLITQREVGFDTRSFSKALKQVLRQDPDVILVGEIRDTETAATVLMAAETGHLVLSTGHSSSAPLAIERIIDLFPGDQQLLARTRIAAVLQGVLCQRLLPRWEGLGRVPAVEIMIANSAVRSLIREGEIHHLQNVIDTGANDGMCTMEDAMNQLYSDGIISEWNNMFSLPKLYGAIGLQDLQYQV